MLPESKIKEYSKRLILARMHLLSTNGFFGLLLMHAEFALDSEVGTAATDGKKIYFDPKFMDELLDSELEFVLMHEVMHMAFGHCLRTGDRDPMLFNIACDIVVNSNILKACDFDKNSITLKKYGESMHLAPDGKEGYLYTAEEVYNMLSSKKKRSTRKMIGNPSVNEGWDVHDKWKEQNDLTQAELDAQAEWQQRVVNASKAIQQRKEALGVGKTPALAEIYLKELKTPQLDWREILSSFIQEEVVDYSFSPPDKRYQDSPFYLPDYNDTDVIVKNILFMIDTSGSMSLDMITQAYSEIKGAIDQFDGKLQGLLGFFEASVIPPIPFSDEQSFSDIKPKGRGGTDFKKVFEYVRENMKEDLPASIIILTDGYDAYPEEKIAMNIPVLWIITNENVTPPWGKEARIKP